MQARLMRVIILFAFNKVTRYKQKKTTEYANNPPLFAAFVPYTQSLPSHHITTQNYIHQRSS